MVRRYVLTAAVLIAFGVSSPSPAGASTGWTATSGTLVPVGRALTGVSTDFTLRNTKFGTLTCEKFSIPGKVTKDSAAEGVEEIGTGEGFGTGCKTGTNATPAEDFQLDNLKSPASTPGQGTASFTYTITEPGGLVCHYTGTNVPFTYTSGTDRGHVTDGTVSVTPPSCVSTTPKLTASFTTFDTVTGVGVNFM